MITDLKCQMASQETSALEPSEWRGLRDIYTLPEIQNKVHPEMFATFLHVSSNFMDSSIISLQNK